MLYGHQVSDLELASLDGLLLTAEAQQKDRPNCIQAAAGEPPPIYHQAYGRHPESHVVASISASLFSRDHSHGRQAASRAQPPTVGQLAAHHATFSPAFHYLQTHAYPHRHSLDLPPLNSRPVLAEMGDGSHQASLQLPATRTESLGDSATSLDAPPQQAARQQAIPHQGGLGQIAEQLWPATAGGPSPSGRSSSMHAWHQQGLPYNSQQQQQQSQGDAIAREAVHEERLAQEHQPSGGAQSLRLGGHPSTLQQHPTGPQQPLQRPHTHFAVGISNAAVCGQHLRPCLAASLPQPADDQRRAAQSDRSVDASGKGVKAGTGPQHARKLRSGRRMPASMDTGGVQPPSKPEMPFLKFTASHSSYSLHCLRSCRQLPASHLRGKDERSQSQNGSTDAICMFEQNWAGFHEARVYGVCRMHPA